MIWDTTSSAATSGALNSGPATRRRCQRTWRTLQFAEFHCSPSPRQCWSEWCGRERFQGHAADGQPGIHCFSGDRQVQTAARMLQSDNKHPTRIESTDELINHTIALPPTRPIVEVSPIFIMPTVSVLKTNGAITILISRRKISVRSVMLSDRF